MKNKTKSIIRRILALVAVAIIVTFSIVPCFAFSERLNAYTENIPIYLEMVETAHYNTSDGFSSEGFYYGTMFTLDAYDSYISGNYTSPFGSFPIYEGYNSDTNECYVNYYRSAFDLSNGTYFASYYDVDYRLSAGNFVINPSEDDFWINISSNETDYYIEASLTYVELGENSDGELKTYVTTRMTDNYTFELDDVLLFLGVGNVDVFVYTWNIRFYAWEIDDSNDFSVLFSESESLIERNTTHVILDSNGAIVDDEMISVSPLEKFFEELGLKEYKQSFDRYTADYTSWLGTAVGGFLNMELFPYFSIGGILLICVSLGLVGYILKVFMGG